MNFAHQEIIKTDRFPQWISKRCVFESQNTSGKSAILRGILMHFNGFPWFFLLFSMGPELATHIAAITGDNKMLQKTAKSRNPCKTNCFPRFSKNIEKPLVLQGFRDFAVFCSILSSPVIATISKLSYFTCLLPLIVLVQKRQKPKTETKWFYNRLRVLVFLA